MSRIQIQKTYKIFIDGKFPRTESARYYPVYNSKKELLANMCLSSRKDFRNAVVAARKAFPSWSSKTHFNRSQILYRIGEMLETRKVQFIEEIMLLGKTKAAAEKEINLSIDRCIYYAGWCDKYQQVFSSVNPVSSSHFNFSVCEAMGVISIIGDEKNALLDVISTLLPAIAGGNTVVFLASEKLPLCAISFAEVLATSDLPSGVVNIITGKEDELFSQFANHMDVNAVVYGKENKTIKKEIQALSSQNVKRFFDWNKDWIKDENENPYLILDLQEIKTTWHPIEDIATSAGKY
ncbi:MAG: aldehyde dehydrogenase family protein [Chitinophagaceae bacterium]|nr:aldehyde dehydrogenase family protein [Chitinophagaceae bacterium]